MSLFNLTVTVLWNVLAFSSSIRGVFQVEMPQSIWRSIPLLRNPLQAHASLAVFHSTPASLAKWKSKWNDKDEARAQQQPKNYIRYVVHQKRSDAKKALKDLLLNGSHSKLSFQDEDITRHAHEMRSRNTKAGDNSSDFDYESQSKESGESEPRHSSRKGKRSGNKRRRSKYNFCSEDDDRHPEEIFQATFGNRCYTWSFRSWNDSRFQNSTAGFEWRDGPSRTTRSHRVWEANESNDDSKRVNNRRRAWDTSESDDDDNSSVMGSYSDRLVLGLPPSGPLHIDDVKSAFRTSALKWHPDKHQGPSQAVAGEKFKLCVDAYKSLCGALS